MMAEEARCTVNVTIHPWCLDPSRDEAVRAAEDGRTGPLPTLEECIERVWPFVWYTPPSGVDDAVAHAMQTSMALGCEYGFRKVDDAWAMMPKTASPTSAAEQENKGDRMTKSEAQAAAYRAEAISRAGQFVPSEPPQEQKCTERYSVTERRPVETGGGGNVTAGLRTERVTLEVTHRFADPIARVLLGALDQVLSGPGESVFVMDGSCETTKLTDERDAAIREREEWRRSFVHSEEAGARLLAERNAALDDADALRARVAELESAAKAAPAENADGGSNHAPAASNSSEILTSSPAASVAAGTEANG